MNKVIKIITNKLVNDSVKISIERNSKTNRLLITTTENFKSVQSENELVRNSKHCKVINSYRDGKKQCMQIIKTEILDLKEVLSSEMGDNNAPLVKERALTTVNPNDTAL